MVKKIIWSKEILASIINESISYSECLQKLNLAPAGGNYSTLQRKIEKFDLDTSHFLSQAHNKGKELKPLENLFGSIAIKKRLIKIRGRKCEKCINSTWNEKPIPLELEHIDGNNRNHNIENLLLLCCNCHAQTPTWRNRKRMVLTEGFEPSL